MPWELELNEIALEAAADRLDLIGRRYKWWPTDKVAPWRQLDPIGRDEFLDLVATVIEGYELKVRELKRDGSGREPVGK